MSTDKEFSVNSLARAEVEPNTVEAGSETVGFKRDVEKYAMENILTHEIIHDEDSLGENVLRMVKMHYEGDETAEQMKIRAMTVKVGAPVSPYSSSKEHAIVIGGEDPHVASIIWEEGSQMLEQKKSASCIIS